MQGLNLSEYNTGVFHRGFSPGFLTGVFQNQKFQTIQLITSLIVPFILVLGSYIALKIDVTRNQERIAAMKEDTDEIKTDVKDIKKHLIIN